MYDIVINYYLYTLIETRKLVQLPFQISLSEYHILQVTRYLQEIAPDLCDRVMLFDKRTPIFDEYHIEEEINNILSKRYVLKFSCYEPVYVPKAILCHPHFGMDYWLISSSTFCNFWASL